MRFAFEWCGYRYRIIERVCERLVNELSMKLRKKNGGEIRSSNRKKVESGIVMNLIRSSTIRKLWRICDKKTNLATRFIKAAVASGKIVVASRK